MKQKLTFAMLLLCPVCFVQAQKPAGKTTAYAITSQEKGSSKWTEVKFVDLVTGKEIRSVYESKSISEPLNARTKQPIEKKDEAAAKPVKRFITLPADPKTNTPERKVMVYATSMLRRDAPFASSSAACAYDSRHERLYYTPMWINELRYIDLKTNKIYYFENEDFGVVSGGSDVQNQVTRMVIAADGNGYALTNDAKHLVQFTTNKKATITDLGAVEDASSNGENSIHSKKGYGGDMIADDEGNLYVISANRNVFMINLATKQATFKGSIKGLPAGFTTNGAAVEKGSSIIVASSTATGAYYRFDLNNLQAEKVTGAESVFNASDLANANLASFKKTKSDPVVEDSKLIVADEERVEAGSPKMAIYPNPVTNSVVKLALTNQAAGNYEVRLFDLNGKAISSKTINISGKQQTVSFNLPSQLAKGTYILKMLAENGNVVNTEKLIVE